MAELPPLRAHLFFSYAHTDEARLLPFVEQLALKLERTIWVDKEGIERGTDWENSIKRGIDESYGVIFALTKGAVNSAYILEKEIEWAYQRFNAIQGASLFIIRLDDIKIPLRLQTPHITYKIDALDGDLDKVIAELGKPGVLPQPRASGHPFLVNWQRLANFKGRDDALLKLHRTLIGESGRAGIKTVGAFGMGGIGKTQLAVEYAHRYRFYYPAGVYWINAAADWGKEIAEIAEYLGLKPLDPEAPDRNGQLALAFEKYLQAKNSDALIVLDNVAAPKEIDTHPIGARLTMRALSDNSRAKLLLTTRVQDMPSGMSAVEIGVLSAPDARAALMEAWTTGARTDSPDVTSLDTLAKAVGYLPLALGWQAAALREIPDLTPTELLAELREGGIDAVAGQLREEGVSLGTPEHYEALVGVALDWSLSRLKRSESLDLLTLIAAYGEAAVVPVERLRLLSGLQDKGIRRPFSGALEELRAYSLNEVLDDGIRLHPLTGEHICKTRDAAGALAAGTDRLTNAYRDPETLTKATEGRRFAAVLEDVRATNQALKRITATVALYSLPRLSEELEWMLLRLEPTMMRLPSDVGQLIPADTFQIQQLRTLAHDESDNELRDVCDHWLKSKLHLRTGCGARIPPDRALLRTLVGHSAYINGALALAGGGFLSWSEDKTLRLWSNDGSPLLILNGHSRPIRGALALSDGRFLSWSIDNTLRLWSNDGSPLHALEAHSDWINGALELADGRLLSWSSDTTLRLWSNDGDPLSILEGHTASVIGALALADGRFLSWSDDSTLHLWSNDGSPLCALEGHSNRVKGTLALIDGRFLSWSADGTLRLWSSDGSPLHTLEGHSAFVNGALALSNGKLLSWSDDGTLRLWSNDGDLVHTLEGHSTYVNGALALADGRFLSWSGDGALRLWSNNGDPLYAIEEHSSQVNGALALSDGCFLSWSDDRTFRLWSNDGAPLRTLEGHTSSVVGALALRDGRFLSWSDDTTLCLWLNDSNLLHTIDGHYRAVKGALTLLDGRFLSWSDDHTLRLWSNDGNRLHTLNGHSHWVHGALALSDGRFLSWSEDNTLRLWSNDGSPLRVLNGHSGWINGALVLPDGRFLSWSSDSTLRLWSSDGNPLHVLNGHSASVINVQSLPDGRLLSCSSDSTLRLWSSDGNPLGTLEEHTYQVRGALVLPDGRLVSWSMDNALCLWSSDGSLLWLLEGHTDSVSGALVLPDGRFLSWSYDKTLRLWSNDGSPLHSLEGHTSLVNGALALPDNRLLSWSADGTLRLWSSDGSPLHSFEGHRGLVNGALAMNDGRFLSWAEDGSLRLWSSDGEPLAVYMNGDAITMCVTLGGNRFAFGDMRGRVVVFEVRG